MDIRSFFVFRCNEKMRERVDESFSNMIRTFVPESIAEHTSIVIEYRIHRCGIWFVVITNKTCKLHVGGEAPKPDLRLSTNRKTWLAIADGFETGESMYMKGKLHAKGDQSILIQLPQLFNRENYH
uniref:SCP-2 sterol transfer family protein n=1 Tax=Candidatus Kentrum sp. FM TaxID=2126340 RepID=A0A450S2L1_9GAMM|nr:MAG: SCP-2 sterol transfer family protein [Candidatus Kentron sp. FM]VFJ46014.1 MAG: SCP-2 sterol transfer family protein [Candidatus Kentron sp. FM]VFK07033.1 MAG: SCP-2 sterol transfer family protein [Candidatus Kentron sp. FM]